MQILHQCWLCWCSMHTQFCCSACYRYQCSTPLLLLQVIDNLSCYHGIHLACVYHVCSPSAPCSDCCDYNQLIIARVNTRISSVFLVLHQSVTRPTLSAKNLCKLSIHRLWCTHSWCMCAKHRTLSSKSDVCCNCSCLMTHDRYDP